VISAIRKASALAKPDAAIPFVPALPDLVGVPPAAVPVEVEEAFEQLMLDGMVKVLESVRSAH
jgi:hypothetical protein